MCINFPFFLFFKVSSQMNLTSAVVNDLIYYKKPDLLFFPWYCRTLSNVPATIVVNVDSF